MVIVLRKVKPVISETVFLNYTVIVKRMIYQIK